MSAERLAKALGGRKVGSTWMASCPAHDDRQPSLSISESESGTVLVRCHAGCDQAAVVLRLRSLGLWPYAGRQCAVTRRQPNCGSITHTHGEDVRRGKKAMDIWEAAKEPAGTYVEGYLKSRGVHLPIPPTLRFHPRLKHPSGGLWPAMVALVTGGTDDLPLAVHRTFLDTRSVGKAPIMPQRMMLGPCHGGAVRLATPCDVLMVGEGLETCLAAMQATGHSAWAALSTSGLRALNLPDDVRDIIVLADGDAPGEAAARDCALRWKREGRRVRIARPPQGMDFNDMLMDRGSSIEVAAQ